MTRIIAVANHKGGSGKTTTTYYIGLALANAGHNVLLIDFDDQGTLSEKLNATPGFYTISEVLDGEVELKTAVRPTRTPNLNFIAANYKLSWLAAKMQASSPNHAFLKRAWNQWHENYSFVLIDCPPSTGILLINALALATEVLIPSTPTEESYAGLLRMQTMIKEIEEILDHRINLTGVIATILSPASMRETHYLTLMEKHFPILARIPRRVGVTADACLASAYADAAEILIYGKRG